MTTLLLRYNTVGNFEVERPDNSVIGAVWCRTDKKWVFHLYNAVWPERTEDERRQIKVILENLNGPAGVVADNDGRPRIGPLSQDGIEGLDDNNPWSGKF